jgi:hypothetical protein
MKVRYIFDRVCLQKYTLVFKGVTSNTCVRELIVLEMGAQAHPHLPKIIVIKHHIN